MPTEGVGYDILIRLIGAVCGAILGLVFIPPRTVRGFFYRLTASLIGGVVFASTVQSKAGFEPTPDGIISAACMAGFLCWPIMGRILALVKEWRRD